MKLYPILCGLGCGVMLAMGAWGDRYAKKWEYTLADVDFPGGAVSFADYVVSYEPGFAGGPEPTAPKAVNPEDVIGSANFETNEFTGAVSLGRGGRITVKFTDNVLTGSNDDRPDLYIFEVGPALEDVFVEVSRDGVHWHAVGSVGGGYSYVDLDQYGFTARDVLRYVRLQDDPAEGSPSIMTIGADIDAVGAIQTVATDDLKKATPSKKAECSSGDERSLICSIYCQTPQGEGAARVDPSPVLIVWPTEPDKVYQAQARRVDGDEEIWANLGQPVAGDGGEMQIMDRDGGAACKMYRVLLTEGAGAGE